MKKLKLRDGEEMMSSLEQLERLECKACDFKGETKKFVQKWKKCKTDF